MHALKWTDLPPYAQRERLSTLEQRESGRRDRPSELNKRRGSREAAEGNVSPLDTLPCSIDALEEFPAAGRVQAVGGARQMDFGGDAAVASLVKGSGRDGKAYL